MRRGRSQVESAVLPRRGRSWRAKPAAKIRAVKWKYAFVATSSQDFAQRKEQELVSFAQMG